MRYVAVYTLDMIRAVLLLLAIAAIYAQPATLPSRDMAVRTAAKGVMKRLVREKSPSWTPDRIKIVEPPARDTTVCASPLTPMDTGRPGRYSKRTVPLGETIDMPAIVAPAPPCPVI